MATHSAPRGGRTLRALWKAFALLALFALTAGATGWTIELGSQNPITLWVMVPITILVFIVTAGYAEWLITGTDPTDYRG